MAQTPVVITPGTGGASIAAELVGGTSWQQVEVYGGGGSSVLSINPDGSIKASIIGIPTVSFSGSPSISGAVTIVGTPSISGTVNIGAQSGSVVAFQGGTNITSIVSSTPSSVLVGASIFGQLPAGNAILGAVAASISGTVATTLSGNPSISGTVNIAGNPSISGTVNVSGLQGSSVSGTVGASIIGQLPAGTATIGSVATLQGTVPWIISSVYGNVSGSVVSFQGGAWSTSVMSFLAPTSSFISGVTSVMTGTGQTSVLTAAGTNIKNYVTHIICTNGAAVGTFVDIKDGGGNVIYSGYAAASGGGFSSHIYPPLVGSANKSVDAQPRTQASIIVAMTGYTA